MSKKKKIQSPEILDSVKEVIAYIELYVPVISGGDAEITLDFLRELRDEGEVNG
jgi:hypothetical protein